VGVPSVYPQLLELRKSKNASFKTNPYLKPETKLRYYQVIGSLHMMMLQRMVLGDGTGLGKSLQTLAAYAFCLNNNPSLKLLVVCQKSAMYQWGEEIDKFLTSITYRVVTNELNGITGSQARKMHYTQFSENVMIINYAPILDEYEMIKQSLGSNYMVAWDECVAFKSRKTKTHFAAQQISESAQRVYGLSATIIKNGLEEVYGIYDVVVPGLFGKITHFKKKYCVEKRLKLRIKGKIRQIPKVIGYKNLKEFKTVIDPYFLIRKKEEVAEELPKLISRKVVLEMYPDQKELYKEALNGILYEEKVKQEFYEISDRVRNGDDSEKTLAKYNVLREKYNQFLTEEGKKRGKLAALTYCQMISNGPSLVQNSAPSSKEDEFRRLLEEELISEKIIVFSRFKGGIPNLQIICERMGLKHLRITGDDSSKDRDIARKLFQEDPSYRIMFISTAGSASLNLQSAGVIIFYDTPWSYGDLVQTIGRAQRIGSIQEHILLIHLVNKGTIDMRVMNRVSDKKNLSDEILGDTAEGALDFTKSEDSVVNDLFADLMKDAENFS
jgi:SNF2 family DNA or RNA helicase